MGVGEVAATTLALVVHELATNSLKYGSLSVPTGVLDVSCDASESDFVVLIWTEQGGPSVVAPSGSGGYGSKLVLRAMSAQLDGTIERNWSSDGVVVRLRINKARLFA
jgi:two-component sensor histidine kinase